ncbi:hypothetical protein [Bradyrhizobium sp. Cp5.3]|uniref:hypothetical protein n=1 Tax=Bradyrhizobium sp. Cp5.3 TaxID=443598 RepID=UPI00048636B4|nr:hypothetical protein [Bradyrhizobium sp. Cp5.3]
MFDLVASNAAAHRLYRAAGFKEYGFERRALKAGSKYYDELLMILPQDTHRNLHPAIDRTKVRSLLITAVGSLPRNVCF